MTTSPEAMLEEHPISERRILTNEGELPRRLTVFCETRGESAEVDDCGGCPHCTGIRIQGRGDPGAVRCAPKPSTATLRARGLNARVSQVMSRDVICVTDDLSAETAAAPLLERGLSATAVVNHAGRLTGMISKTDLLRVVQEASGASLAPPDLGPPEEMDPSLQSVRASGPSVADAMTRLVFAVPGRAELTYAAALMAAEGVLQLPVISSDGAVEGMITALDVMAWVGQLSAP